MQRTVLAILLAATAAHATPCDLSTSKPLGEVFPQPVAIPDHDPSGIVLGPIHSTSHPGEIISNIILEVKLQHTWVGDLRIQDVGAVCEWTVWEDKQPPVGIEAAPWGRVKSLYR